MNKQLTICCLLLLIGVASAAYKCVANTNGCTTCGGTALDSCSACKTGWYLDTTAKTCAQCAITGCSDCSDKTTCKTPAAGYSAYQGSLVACGEGCATCTATSSTEKTCLTAAAGYYLNANILNKCAANCVDCGTGNSDVANCKKAADGYFFDVGLGKCTIANCIICPNNRNLCDTCAAGFLKSTAAVPTCDACTIKNCISCKTLTTCDNCISGYKFDTTTSTCQQCQVPGCAICSQVTTCDTCIDNQLLSSSNTCLKCAENCTGCSQNGAGYCDSDKCDSNNGYKYNLTTKLCGKGCGDDNCNTCTNNGICEKCNQGYGLNTQSLCGLCDTNCLSTCYTNGAGKCDTGNCKAGYTLNITTKQCTSCSTTDNLGCKTCSYQTTTPNILCSTCQTGYYNNSGYCVSCTKADVVSIGGAVTGAYDANAATCHLSSSTIVVDSCNLDSVIYNLACYKCSDLVFQIDDVTFWQDPNALGCTVVEPIQILTCINGYYPNATNQCVSCTGTGGVANCKICASTTTCLQCNIDFYLSAANTCTAATNCIHSAAVATPGCDGCKDDYTSGGTTCTSVTGCHFGSTDCDQCTTGNALSGSKTCVTKANCVLSATATPWGCVQCEQDFYWDGTACTTMTGCILSASSKCVQCVNGKFWDGSACTTMTGCILSASSKCSQCLNDFYWNGTACASLTGCILSASSACSQCAVGYYDSGSCKACSNTSCTCTSASSCTGCKDDYVFNGTTCVTSTGCAAAVAGTATTCTACKTGYNLFRGACRSLSKVKVLTGKGTAAVAITQNHLSLNLMATSQIIVGLISTACVDNAWIINGNYCLTCQKTGTVETLAGQITTANQKPNCKKCSLTNLDITCTECISPSALFTGGLCVQCGSNCLDQQCGTNGVGKCEDGQCKPKFGLDSTTKTCLACAQNCSSCNSKGAGKCDSQDYCDTGFFITAAFTCKNCAPNCASCSSNGGDLCDTCNAGYYIVAQKCNPCYSENCLQCSSPSLFDCKPKDGWGKYFSSTDSSVTSSTAIKSISACVSNCAVCFGSNFADCQIALPKYFIDTAAITKCPDGCDSCKGTTPDKCTLSTGYYVDTTATPSVIKACPTGCAKCSVSGTAAAPVVTCSACIADYAFDPSQTTTKVCFMNCIANCDKCTTQDVNGCSACKTGYTKGTTGCSSSGTTATGSTTTTTSNATIISTLFVTFIVALFLLF